MEYIKQLMAAMAPIRQYIITSWVVKDGSVFLARNLVGYGI
jgi:hypothetical protein